MVPNVKMTFMCWTLVRASLLDLHISLSLSLLSVLSSTSPFILHKDSHEWKQFKLSGKDKPGKLAGHTANVIGDKLYIFGGRSVTMRYLAQFHLVSVFVKM